MIIFVFKIKKLDSVSQKTQGEVVEEMAQRLRPLAVLAKDQYSIPDTHIQLTTIYVVG